MIRMLVRALRGALPDDRGFTMVSVMITMMVLGTFAAAAYSAANGDIPMARSDQDRKAAYEAAEAGIQWYTHQLEQSTNAWATCTPSTQGVNMEGSRASWRNVDSVSGERFAIELMPPVGKTCDMNALDSTLLDNGVLRIRSTGTFRNKTRQIVATFRRDGFLDFVWYTKRETSPPAAYNGSGTTPAWVAANCDKVRAQRPSGCQTIVFVGNSTVNDDIQGPMHTEDDSFAFSGTPTFGRAGAGDKIEVSGAGTSMSTAFYNAGSGGGVNNLGVLVAPGKTVDPPQDNTGLRNFADITIAGDSCLTFNGSSVTISDKQTGWGSATAPITCNTPNNSRVVALGPDTVIWVDNNPTCTTGYQMYQRYPADTCANVAVSGHYNTNVTIGSANDIIVTGNLTRDAGSDALMGLVANQFVRVYHPIQFGTGTTCGASTPNLFSTPAVSRIDAAILATQGSFLNDNWFCGSGLGSLSIRGTIAQYWRGAVGTGAATTGYIKDYAYDNRLKYRQPPQFLDPAASQWHILRQTENVPVQ